jgi:ADP-ribose pyrophosphatase YjhB (NUDIX family)
MNPRYTPLKPRYTQLAFCPRCGSPYRPADFDGADVVFRCATCGFHFYQNSIPSGVAVVPKADDPSLVVLLTRANEPGRGQLALPGGLLKYGEPPADGARREAREEVLLDVDVDRLLMTHLVDYSYQGGRDQRPRGRLLASGVTLSNPAQRASLWRRGGHAPARPFQPLGFFSLFLGPLAQRRIETGEPHPRPSFGDQQIDRIGRA